MAEQVPPVAHSNNNNSISRNSVSDDDEATVIEAQDPFVDVQFINDELLTYAQYHFKRCSKLKLLKTIMVTFTNDDITLAKRKLFKIHKNDITPTVKEVRRKTNNKSLAEAETDDILSIFTILDRKGLLGKVMFCAINIAKLPKYKPEEADMAAILERVEHLEIALMKMKTNYDEDIPHLRNMSTLHEVQIREVLLKDTPTYSDVVTSTPNKSPVTCSPAAVTAPRLAADTGSPARKETTDTGATAHPVVTANDAANTRSTVPPVTAPSNTDSDGFQIPKRLFVKEKRRRARETGANTSCEIKGVPREHKRTLIKTHFFISRIDSETDDNKFNTYINNKLCGVQECRRISHNDAPMKSFLVVIDRTINTERCNLNTIAQVIPQNADCSYYRFPKSTS